jgi:hypothetical protein
MTARRLAAALLVLAAASVSLAPLARAGTAEPSTPEAARAEVRHSLESGGYDWYDRATDGPNLERLAHELDDPQAGAKKWRWLVWLLDAVALAVLLSIVAYVIRAARRARLLRPPVTPAEAPRPLEALPFEDPELGVDPHAWLRAAEEAAARGDFARAVVCLFNGELLILDRSHAIRLGPGRTNRHYLSELAIPAPGPESFSSAIREFERVFYGGRGADRASFERFQEDHRRLVATLPGQAP